MGVDVVTLFDILQYLVVVGVLSLAFKLVVAALGADSGRGSDENLQLSLREDGCADITARP